MRHLMQVEKLNEPSLVKKAKESSNLVAIENKAPNEGDAKTNEN